MPTMLKWRSGNKIRSKHSDDIGACGEALLKRAGHLLVALHAGVHLRHVLVRVRILWRAAIRSLASLENAEAFLPRTKPGSRFEYG